MTHAEILEIAASKRSSTDAELAAALRELSQRLAATDPRAITLVEAAQRIERGSSVIGTVSR